MEPTTLSTAYQAEEIYPSIDSNPNSSRPDSRAICFYWILPADFGSLKKLPHAALSIPQGYWDRYRIIRGLLLTLVRPRIFVVEVMGLEPTCSQLTFHLLAKQRVYTPKNARDV